MSSAFLRVGILHTLTFVYHVMSACELKNEKMELQDYHQGMRTFVLTGTNRRKNNDNEYDNANRMEDVNKNETNSPSSFLQFLRSTTVDIFSTWCIIYSIIFSLLSCLLILCLLIIPYFFFVLESCTF